MSGRQKVVTCKIQPLEKLGKATYITDRSTTSEFGVQSENPRDTYFNSVTQQCRYRVPPYGTTGTVVPGADSVEVLAKKAQQWRNQLKSLPNIALSQKDLTEIRPVPKSLPFIGFFSKACRMPESSPNIGLNRRACQLPGRTLSGCLAEYRPYLCPNL